jgi:hypothetical protein
MTLFEELVEVVHGAELPVSARHAADILAEDVGKIRAAMREANLRGLADLVRHKGSRELFLVQKGARAPGRLNICAQCQGEFERRNKSKARTCSRPCSAALSWKNPGTAEKRIASIKEQKATPEAKAQNLEANRRRWSRPGERERLAEHNRTKKWADPAIRAKMSRGIRRVAQTPEARAFYADLRRKEWQDEEKRNRRIKNMRRAKSTPHVRAKFSDAMKARWRDPEQRKKFLRAGRKAAQLGGAANKQRIQEARP